MGEKQLIIIGSNHTIGVELEILKLLFSIRFYQKKNFKEVAIGVLIF